MKALADIVSQGKALYIGLSNYPAERALQAQKLLKEFGVNLLIHQPRLSMLDRWLQRDKLDVEMEKVGVGLIPFSILAQGLLTTKYLKEIPKDSRIGNPDVPFLNENSVTEELRAKLVQLNEMASKRGQTLAEMAVSWTCVQRGVSTVLLGVSRLSQLESNLKAISNLEFTKEELDFIDKITK